MRTKTLICAAAVLAAGLASSIAQTVYSQNVVGYVNVVIPSGYSAIANPLDASNSGGNSISNLFNAAVAGGTGPAAGDAAYSWNGVFNNGNFNSDLDGSWSNPTEQFAPGKGIFYQNVGAPFTNTFVGEVMQGSLTVPLPFLYNSVASKVPQAGYAADLGLIGAGADVIYLWNGNFNVGSFRDDLGGTWSDAAGFVVDPVKGPFLNVAQSIFYNNVSGAATWVRNFTVN